MVSVPSSVSVKCITIGSGLSLEYLPCHAALISQSLTVGIQITDASLLSPVQPDQPIDLRFILSIGFLKEHLDQKIYQSIASLKLPFEYHCVLTNASLVHLAQLLKAELAAPQPMSRPFLESIATVLIASLLQTASLPGLDTGCL